MNIFIRQINLSLLFLLWLTPTIPSYAGNDDRAGLFVKTLGYVRGLETGRDGNLQIGIVYDAGNSASMAEAQSIKNELLSLKKAKQGPLAVDLIAAPSLGDQSEYQAFIITKDMSNYFDRIKKTVAQNTIFSMSSDPDCARQDCCIVAIEQNATTKIYLNESTMEDIGFDIDTTFRYLAIRL